jgi:hypothetical protein
LSESAERVFLEGMVQYPSEFSEETVLLEPLTIRNEKRET